MQMYQLHPHAAFPPKLVERIDAGVIGLDSDFLRVRWRIAGSQELVVPPYAGRGRQDELWRTTCFEVFLKPDSGHAYTEINLSPSGRWAAYDFAEYRDGMEDRPASREPETGIRVGSNFAIVDAAIPRDLLPQLPGDMGLSAILEEEGGVMSYWAIAHPEAKPDFHDPACFAATLAAPPAP